MAVAAHLRHVPPPATRLSQHLLLNLRGGSSSDDISTRDISSSVAAAAAETKYVTLDGPAPGSRKFKRFTAHV